MSTSFIRSVCACGLLGVALNVAAEPTSPLCGNQTHQVSRTGDRLLVSTIGVEPPATISIALPEAIEATQVERIDDPIWGRGQRIAITHADKSTTLTLYDESPFAQLETRVSNPGAQPLELQKLSIADLTVDLGVAASRLNSLGTPGLRPIAEPSPSYAYSVVADPKSRRGVVTGWLTQRQGVGVVSPSLRGNSTHVETFLDFGQYRVNPHQTRGTDTLVLGVFEDARLGLEQYGAHIAKAYQIRLRPKPCVYCTWYHRPQGGWGSSTEQLLRANADFAQEQLRAFGLNVMQIDDHWQIDSTKEVPQGSPPGAQHGPIKLFTESRADLFPNGMAAMAGALLERGFTPGIWFIPFSGTYGNPNFDPAIFVRDRRTGQPLPGETWSGNCIDVTSPQGEAYLRGRVKRIHNWGYRYFKLDGLHTGAPSRNIYVHREYGGETFDENAEVYNKDMTYVQAFRHGLEVVRQEAPDTFLLGCNTVQNQLCFAPSFGLLDAMRVGPDNGGAAIGRWSAVLKFPKFAGNLWFLHNRVWYNDPDPVYVRESAPLSHVQCMLSFVAVTGMMHSSSMQYADLPPERLDLLKRSLPSHDLDARPVDILEHETPALWVVKNDRMAVVGAFNWDAQEDAEVKESLERMGLDPTKQYEAYEFWGDCYLGAVRGGLRVALPKASCQVIALREATDRPQVLSTSRHITQGLQDVVHEGWDPKQNTLRGTSQVVESDPYELRVVCPPGFRLASATVAGDKASVGPIRQSNGLARLTLSPTATGRIDWKLAFSTVEP